MIKKIIIFLIITLVISGIFLYMVKNRYKNTTFVLLYHRIGDYSGKGLKGLSVRKSIFEKQMEYLYGKGYRTIALTELIENIKINKKIPEKTFVITFDDGYETTYTSAFSVLKKYNWTATVFLTAGYIGKKGAYPGQPPEEHLKSSQIKEMTPYFDFGSHTFSHISLKKLDKSQRTKELEDSKKIIENITCKKITCFAYPFGEYNNEIKKNVKDAGYICALTSKPGIFTVKTDIYEIPRFECKEISAMNLKYFFDNIDFYLRIFFGL